MSASQVDPVNELMVLIRSRHPLIAIDTPDPPRAHEIAALAASHLGVPWFVWSRTKGLRRKGDLATVYETADSVAAFKHIELAKIPALWVFEGLSKDLEDATRVQALRDAMEGMRGVDAAIILADGPTVLQPPFRSEAAVLRLPRPTRADYVAAINRVVAQLQVRVKLKPDIARGENVDAFVNALSGMTISEAERRITKAIMDDGALTAHDVAAIMQDKHEHLKSKGLLEFCTVDVDLEQVAGLSALKAWLETRRAVVQDPVGAAAHGLPFPRGMLLVGVPGCGKSMCAKAVAADWKLPLLRMDTSGLFDKYVGESEKRFLAAIDVAERASPSILWIDEIEKAFTAGSESDSGVSTRVLGTFLSWLQDRKGQVFVVATANDITKLPAEAMRKGRFDEIFFVDLPTEDLREAIFRLHVARRTKAPDGIDFKSLAQRTEGFSGAEIEQAVVSAAYAAFARKQTLDMAGMMAEIDRTVPLATTMYEKIGSLREWARGRTVSANG